MKIALVGQGAGGQDAPFNSPEWQTWALTTDPHAKHRADVLFQMHEMKVMKSCGTLDDLIDNGIPGPVYWQYPPETIEDTVFLQYPLDLVIKSIGRDWFASTAAYMLAYAIAIEPKEIGLWGFHMAENQEYLYQRSNLCWLLGIAEGKGVKVTAPEGCRLINYYPQFEKYPKRYGYINGPELEANRGHTLPG